MSAQCADVQFTVTRGRPLWFLHMSLEVPSGVWSTFTLKYAQESRVFHSASSALHLTSKYVSVNVSMVLCTRSRAIVEAE